MRYIFGPLGFYTICILVSWRSIFKIRILQNLFMFSPVLSYDTIPLSYFRPELLISCIVYACLQVSSYQRIFARPRRAQISYQVLIQEIILHSVLHPKKTKILKWNIYFGIPEVFTCVQNFHGKAESNVPFTVKSPRGRIQSLAYPNVKYPILAGRFCAGILEQSMGARNREGIGLLFLPPETKT
jgi:hypothetical protein